METNTQKGWAGTAQATKEELREGKLRCWRPNCKRVCLVEDRAGWRWCIEDYFRQRDGYFSKRRKIIWKHIPIAIKRFVAP